MRLRYLNGVRGSLDVMIGIRNTELVFTSLFNSIDDFHVMEPNFLVNFGSTRSVHSYCNRITVVYNSYLELSYLYHSNEEVKYRAQAVKRTWHRVHVYFEVIVSSSNALRESRSKYNNVSGLPFLPVNQQFFWVCWLLRRKPRTWTIWRHRFWSQEPEDRNRPGYTRRFGPNFSLD